MYVDISSIIDSINPEDIEDITVITGQTGVQRNGSDAVNGVVIITMKKGGR
jgi:outer membrane receptor for ferrienterochelin and colicin